MLNVSSPPPPYCSGAASAQRPAAFVLDASRSQSSDGRPGASGSSRCSSGMISSRTKRRICSRRRRSSSGSVKPAKVGGIGGDDTIAAMSDRVSRRALITFGVALLTAPLAAVAQSGRVYTVGTLSMGTATQMDWWQPFLDALREAGYVEGRNLVVKRSRAAGRPERLVGLAQELVQAKVDVIVATGPPRETRAARQVTST